MFYNLWGDDSAASRSLLRDCDWGWGGGVGEDRSKVYHPGRADWLHLFLGLSLPSSTLLIFSVHCDRSLCISGSAPSRKF